MPQKNITAFHVSPIYNRASIVERGILPTYIQNSTHRELMISDGTAGKDGKAIYTWLDSENNSKYIRDLIYAITWIHPRNAIGDYFELVHNEWLKFHDVDHRRPIWTHNEMIFDVYAIKALGPEGDTDYQYTHIQKPAPDTDNTAAVMHDEFAHFDKKLIMYTKPLTEFRIVGQGYYKYDEPNNSFAIKVLR